MVNNISIREMSRRTGLSAYTLRYYERAGLIKSVAKNPSGHRRYTGNDDAWIAFLNKLRATGMPIRQMREFARLRAAGDHTVLARRILLESHQQNVADKIRTLQQCATALAEKICYYQTIEHTMTLSSQPKSTGGTGHEQSIRTRTQQT